MQCTCPGFYAFNFKKINFISDTYMGYLIDIIILMKIIVINARCFHIFFYNVFWLILYVNYIKEKHIF